MDDQQRENSPSEESLSTVDPGASGMVASPLGGSLTDQLVSEKSVILDRWIGYVVASVVMLIVVGSTSTAFMHPQIPWWGIGAVILGWAVLGGILAFFAHVHPRWAYERTRWGLTEEGFEIRRGIIWRHQIAIPAARVQHVDVSQGPLQRVYQLGKLTIHTAGTANASVELSGLEHSVALKLRDDLIRQKEMLDDA